MHALIEPKDATFLSIPKRAAPLFPPEIWREILLCMLVERASDYPFFLHRWDKKDPKRHVMSFALVCKEFLGLALPVLYKNVVFGGIFGRNPKYFPGFARDVLNTEKHVHLRTLQLQDATAADIKKVLLLCKNIQSLHLLHYTASKFNSALRMLSKQVPSSLSKIKLNLGMAGALKALERNPAVSLPPCIHEVDILVSNHDLMLLPVLALLERSPNVKAIDGFRFWSGHPFENREMVDLEAFPISAAKFRSISVNAEYLHRFGHLFQNLKRLRISDGPFQDEVWSRLSSNRALEQVEFSSLASDKLARIFEFSGHLKMLEIKELTHASVDDQVLERAKNALQAKVDKLLINLHETPSSASSEWTLTPERAAQKASWMELPNVEWGSPEDDDEFVWY